MHAGKLEGHTQADVKSGGMYGVNNCHGTVFQKEYVVFKTTMYIKKYRRQQLEKCWCAKECPKMPSINTLWL